MENNTNNTENLEINSTVANEKLALEKKTNKNDLFASRGIFIVFLIVVISLVSGGIGGSLGTLYFLKQPEFQKWFEKNPIISQQNIRLEEDNYVIDVVKKASPAVVSIAITKDINAYQQDMYNPFFPFFMTPRQNSTPNFQQVGSGTGFFVTSDGVIMTNRHVVSDENAQYSVITSDGKTYEAKVAARDSVNDLAIVKIDIQNAPTLQMADSDSIQVGQRVVAIGNSLGLYQNTVTSGIVSGIGRSIQAGGRNEGTESLDGVIQTDAAINPGNSGGPLLNALGQVIGINTAIDREGQLVGFAIPVNDAKSALESFKATGKITRPYLGVRYVIINDDLVKQRNLERDYGALIIAGGNSSEPGVVQGSPADKAGLKTGDIILEIDGKKVDNSNTLLNLLKNKKIGQEVKIKIYSAGQEKIINVVLEERK